MPPIPPATEFLAGSLISLLIPIALLIGLAIWLVRVVSRVPAGEPEASATSTAAAPTATAATAATSTAATAVRATAPPAPTPPGDTPAGGSPTAQP
jgi:hypothetical protein